MSRLAQQQAALLNALFAWPAEGAMRQVAAFCIDPHMRGLRAYQANGHAAAERALQSAYPVMRRMVGEDSFADLARALWHAKPPRCGDLGRWGDGLADFVAGSAQLADTPYLADVARLEWLLHRCATAADAEAAPDSLAWLTTHAPEDVQLRLAPGCATLASPWPVVSLVLAHQQAEPDLEALLPQAQDALVWRHGYRSQLRQALPGEADFLQATLQGASLAQGLDAAPALDFSIWFAQALKTGLVCGAALKTGISL